MARLAAWSLYVYDWEHWDGPYLGRAVPGNPVHVNELPSEARTAALRVSVPDQLLRQRGVRGPSGAERTALNRQRESLTGLLRMGRGGLQHSCK